MTWSPGIQKVLDHVAATEGWRPVFADDAARLRCDAGCPLQSWTGRADTYVTQAVRMGLTMTECDIIIQTVDDYREGYYYNPALRAALLKAARLA